MPETDERQLQRTALRGVIQFLSELDPTQYADRAGLLGEAHRRISQLKRAFSDLLCDQNDAT